MIYYVIIPSIVVSALLLLHRIRSAKGIFFAYAWAGVFAPFIAFGVLRLETSQRLIYPLDSRLGWEAFILFCISVAIVAFFPIVKPKEKSSKNALPDAKSQEISNLFSVLSITLGLGYITLVTLIFGGFGAAMQAMQERIVIESSVANYGMILSWLSSVSCIFAYRYAVHRTSILLISAIALFVVESFIIGGRSLLILFGLALIYTDLLRMKFSKFVLTCCAMLVFIGGVSAIFIQARYEAQNAQILRRDPTFIEKATAGITFIDAIALGMDYAENEGYDYGESYKNAALIFVPRQLWPDKPLPLSHRVRYYSFGDALAGLPPALFGEGYIAFGPPGFLAAALLLGYLLALVDGYTVLTLRDRSPSREAIMGICAPMVAFALVRGGIDVAAYRISIPIAACFLCWRLSVYYRRRILRRAARRKSRRSTDLRAASSSAHQKELQAVRQSVRSSIP